MGVEGVVKKACQRELLRSDHPFSANKYKMMNQEEEEEKGWEE